MRCGMRLSPGFPVLSGLVCGGHRFGRGCPISEARDPMVVHHSHGLHEGVANGGTDEIEAPLFEIFAEPVRYIGSRRNVAHRGAPVNNWSAADKRPEIRVEAAEL